MTAFSTWGNSGKEWPGMLQFMESQRVDWVTELNWVNFGEDSSVNGRWLAGLLGGKAEQWPPTPQAFTTHCTLCVHPRHAWLTSPLYSLYICTSVHLYMSFGPRQRLHLSHVKNLSLKASNLTCFHVWEALFSVWSYSLRNFTCVSHDSDWHKVENACPTQWV